MFIRHCSILRCAKIAAALSAVAALIGCGGYANYTACVTGMTQHYSQDGRERSLVVSMADEYCRIKHERPSLPEATPFQLALQDASADMKYISSKLAALRGG